EDIYVMKLDSSGGLAWADHLGGPSFDGGSAISLTPGGVYVAGFYTGNIDFDPGAGTVHLPAGGGGTNDDFILQLTTDGGFLNGWTYGGSDYEFANSMDVSVGGVIGVVGRTDGSGDFEPGPGVANLTNQGGEDGYVVLFNPQGLSVSASPNTFSEAAGAGASTGTITRTGDLSQPLTVQLTSSDTTEATVPVFVTIPASQSSATFPIAAVDDSIPDGPQTVTISASANASSAPQLDPTFGVGGLAPTSLRQSLQFPHEAIAYLPNGQVLAASEQTATSWQVTRLNADGSVDTTFGTNGIAATTLSTPSNTDPVPHVIAVQSDGKFLVGGMYGGGVAAPVLARYNADGSADASFDTNAAVSMTLIGSTFVTDIAVRPDGRILLGLGESGSVFARVAQLTAAGTLDGAFGINGLTSLDSFSNFGMSATQVELLPDGSFLAAGSFQSSARVARVAADGKSLVSSFGGCLGFVSLNFASADVGDPQLQLDHLGRI